MNNYVRQVVNSLSQNPIAAVLDKSFEHAEKADLCLAMGSSLTVTPAADIPEVCYITVINFIMKGIVLMTFRRWAQEEGDWWSSIFKPLPLTTPVS
jgi:NAD-dependent SIR2 family protein deacetylase